MKAQNFGTSGRSYQLPEVVNAAKKKCYQIGKAIAKLLEGENCLKKEWEYSENPT